MSIDNLSIVRAKIEDASRIIDLTAQDLREAGIPEEKIEAIADLSNSEHLIRQERKLKLNPEFYKVAILGKDIVGYAKASEKFVLDQREYAMSAREYYSFTLQDLFHKRHLEGHPLGIHGLVAANDVEGLSQLEIATALLDDVLENQDSKDVHMGIRTVNEPLKPLLKNRYGFRPTDRYGSPSGVYQRLYIRKPIERSEQNQ